MITSIALPYFIDFRQQEVYDQKTLEYQQNYDRMILYMNEHSVRDHLWPVQYDIDRANFYRLMPFQLLLDHANLLDHLLEDDWWEYSAPFRDLYNRITAKHPTRQQWLNNSLGGWLADLL